MTADAEESSRLKYELNPDNRWTPELLKHMRTHGECYSFSKNILDKIENALRNDSAFFGNLYTRDYKLFYDSKYIGHLTFSEDAVD